MRMTPCAAFFGVFAKRTQFLRLLCRLPWFMRMTDAQLFWRSFAQQTQFRPLHLHVHFLSRDYACLEDRNPRQEDRVENQRVR